MESDEFETTNKFALNSENGIDWGTIIKYYNEFGCVEVYGADYGRRLKFLNNVNDVLQELDRIETEKVNNIEKALLKTENIK